MNSISKEFERTLEILNKLKEGGELFVSFSPPFLLSFETDRSALQKALKDLELSEKEFRRAANEIKRVLLAILSDEVEEFITHWHERGNGENGTADSRQELERELKAKIESVRRDFYDDHLQRRYDLKKSSKAPSFTGIDWDIKLKVDDANVEAFKKRPFPYATCRISFQRQFTEEPFALIGGRMFDSMQINFSIDEIVYLQRVLSKIKDGLEVLEREGNTDASS